VELEAGMSLVLIIVWCWCIVGFMLFHFFDKWQMKKEIPYGGFPSIASLREIRIMTCVLSLLFGIFIVVYAIIVSVTTKHDQ
jgi:hypothetical protein